MYYREETLAEQEKRQEIYNTKWLKYIKPFNRFLEIYRRDEVKTGLNVVASGMSGGYDSAIYVSALYRVDDFLISAQLDSYVDDIWIVLNRGQPLQKGMLTVSGTSMYIRSSSTVEVKHIHRGHSGGFFVDGPWWDEWVSKTLPKIGTSLDLAREICLSKQDTAKAKAQLEELRQAKLWLTGK